MSGRRTNKIMICSTILRLGEQLVIRGEVGQKAPPALHLLEMGCEIGKPMELMISRFGESGRRSYR